MAVKRYFRRFNQQKSSFHSLNGLRNFLESRLPKSLVVKKGYQRYVHRVLAYADGCRGDRKIQVATIHVIKRQPGGAQFVSVVLATCPRLLGEIERELLCLGFTTMTIMPPQGLSHLVRRLNWQDLVVPWAVARGSFWKPNLSHSHLVGGSAMMPSRVQFFPCPGAIQAPPLVD